LNNSERYLIVGLGSIGRRHLRNLRLLRPQARIAVLRQRESMRAAPLPEGADIQFDSMADALAFQPQAAIIAGPATTHLPVALALANSNIHLLVEKPLAEGLAGLGDLIRLCREKQLALMVGYNLRFMPSLREVRRLIAEGAIGKIVGARAEVGQYLPDWRPGSDYRETVSARRELGGGVILELSHELDYLYWLLGMPEAVSAKGGHYSHLDLDVEDMVEILLEYSSPRCLVSVHLDMVQRMPVRCCKFIGEEGTLKWDAIADRVDYYRADAGAWESIEGTSKNDRNHLYLDELEQFLGCVHGDDIPLVDGVQGYDVLAIADAARRSIESGTTIKVRGYEQG
jgi:predicted dehydrogenase